MKPRKPQVQAAAEVPSLSLMLRIGGGLLMLAAFDASLRFSKEWMLDLVWSVSVAVMLWQACTAIAARGSRRFFSFGFLLVWFLLHYLNDPAREFLTSVPQFERETGEFFRRFYVYRSQPQNFAPIATEYVILFGAILGGFVTRRTFETDHQNDGQPAA